MKIRQSNFELLRIVSMLFIIAFHFTFHSGVTTQLGTETRVLTDITFMLGELGVNIFILISGYFGINSKFKIKKFIMIALETLFYYIIISSLLYCFKLKANPFNIFENFIGDWWFISCYLVLYLISPYINNLINAQDKISNTKLIYILLIIFCILPTVIGLNYSNSEAMLYYSRFVWFVVIYILGAYISKYDLKGYENIKKSIIKLIISLALLFGSIIVIMGLKLKISSYYFWTPNNILMLFASISMFMVFKHLKIKNSLIINKMASTTLGVYLLHDGISRNIIWKIIDNKTIVENLDKMFLIYLIYVILIFISCMLIDIIRQWIFKNSVEKLIDKWGKNNE